MKTLIIYKSVHQGNTKKIAEAMAEAIGADLRQPHEVNCAALEEYDLLGFGSGIYYWKHHSELMEFIDSMPHKKRKAFIYSTRGGGSKTLCHRAIKKKLIDKGCDIVGEYSCRAYDAVGPLRLIGGINRGRPNQNDLENAKRFIESLVKA